MATPNTSGADDAVSVTPSDTVALADGYCRALHIGVTGDVAVVMRSGRSVTFTGVPAGIFPVKVLQVKATGTTATNIAALY